MRLLPIAAALLAALGNHPASANDGQEAYAGWSSDHWRQAAYHDVLAAYREFVENHPGIYDLANPGFPGQLAAARDAGLGVAIKAENHDDYVSSLHAFNAILSDGHAKAYSAWSSASSGAVLRWPGFSAAWRDGHLLTSTDNESHELAGTRITFCDGEPVEQYILKALEGTNFRPAEKGQWWAWAGALFFTTAAPGKEPAKVCRFVWPDGQSQEIVLEYVEASDSDWRRALSDVAWQAEPIGLHEQRDGIFLIGLGDFQPDEDGQAAYGMLYEQLRERRSDLQEAKALIFDLRGNNGGSSAWVGDVVALLLGAEIGSARGDADVRVLWRTSPDTIDHVGEIAAWLRDRNDERADLYDRLQTQMESAAAKGVTLFDQALIDEKAATDPASLDLETDFDVPVFVINWGACASACLDANDYFGYFADVTRIGAPTSADSTYMEIREVALPYGPGRLVIPSKVWVGRQRGWGEVYDADLPLQGLDWSTEMFIEMVEAALARRQSGRDASGDR